MRLLPRLLAVAAMLLAPVTITVAAPGTACACSCASPAAGEHFDAPFVFAGTVIERTEPQPPSDGVVSSGDLIAFNIAVDTVFKGKLTLPARVHSARDGASCGLGLQTGQRWLFYAQPTADGRLEVGLCGGSHQLGANEALTTVPGLTEPPSSVPSIPASEPVAGSAATEASSPVTTVPPGSAPASPSSDGTSGAAGWIVGGAAVVLVGAALLLLRVRRR